MIVEQSPFSWRPFGRRHHRHLQRSHITLLVVFSLLATWLLLPYDNIFRLTLRSNIKSCKTLWTPPMRDDWVFAQPIRPVDLSDDTLIILQTSYGTKDRARAWLETLGSGNSFRDFIIVADFSSRKGEHLRYHRKEIPIQDTVNKTLSHPALLNERSHPSAQRHRQLQQSIASGNTEIALKLSRTSAQALDAIKILSSLQLAYEQSPHKKWYILAHDDTYLIQPSLKQLLGHLDPLEPHYLGNPAANPIADTSPIILSHTTLQTLFSPHNSHILAQTHTSSLITPTSPSHILRLALLRVGINLNEDLDHLFSGQPPRQAQMRSSRFCSPVVGFFGLGTEKGMGDAGSHLGNVTRPVLWADLWDLYGGEAPWREKGGVYGDGGGGGGGGERVGAGSSVVRMDWDYVGEVGDGEEDEGVMSVGGVSSADECAKKCGRNGRWCMAWSWETGSHRCRMASWMRVGERAMGRMSGVSSQRLRELEMGCFVN